MGGIAACLCMACGGNDSKDYWGDTSGGEDEEPTENPNASKICKPSLTKHANRGFVFMLPSILLSVEIRLTEAQDYCIETSLRQSGQHR